MPVPTRWSSTLSTKVNLPHAIGFRALCGANLVMLRSNSGHFCHTNLFQNYHINGRSSRTLEIVRPDDRKIRSGCPNLSEQATIRDLVLIFLIFVPGLSCGSSVRFLETSSKNENDADVRSRTTIAGIVLNSRNKP